MRSLLLILSVAGTLLFGALFLVSWVKPAWIEGAAQGLLAAQVERRIGPTPALAGGGIAGICEGDCACTAGAGSRVQAVACGRLEALRAERGRLEQAVRATYAEITGRLHREVRIVAGSNAAVFLLLGLVVWRRYARSALLPALVLVGGAALTGGLYLFGQNWLHTIVFDSYLGYGYLAWLGVAVGLLADIAFNRARVIQGITNSIASTLPS